MNLLDVHTHFHMLDIGLDEALANARSQGVKASLTIGTEPGDWSKVFAVAEKHYPEIACTVGLHPHEAKIWTKELGDEMRRMASAKHVVGLGEMGLDYYYNNSSPEDQKRAFIEQMTLAEELDLPVEIHTRDAEQDTAEILNQFRGRVRGLLHCFTGTQWLAQKGLDAGFNISFSGVVTFKNADELRSIAKSTPLDRMHVETDAPFLAPVPQRGKKNQPAFVVHTAEFVAGLRGISVEALAQATFDNAQRLFPKWTL